MTTRWRIVPLALAIVVSLGLEACALHQPPRRDLGIPPCPSAAADDLLAARSLQCWFTAPRGRWRIRSHDSHYNALVVEIGADDQRDAEFVARTFVDRLRERFAEILIYVYPEAVTREAIVRRVQWQRARGFTSVEFPAESP
jgi:hypothetical protein